LPAIMFDTFGRWVAK